MTSLSLAALFTLALAGPATVQPVASCSEGGITRVFTGISRAAVACPRLLSTQRLQLARRPRA